MKGILWKILAGALGLLSIISLYLFNRNQTLNEKKAKAEERARGEREAREHIQETGEKTREVEDRVKRSSAKSRRDKLREFTTGSRDSK